MSFGVIGEDSAISIQVGQFADGSTPVYGSALDITAICRRCTPHESVDMKMTSGIGMGRKVHRAGQSMTEVQLDIIVQSTGALLRGYRGYYVRVYALEHSALATPAPIDGIISDWKMDVSEDVTIESITITCDADTV